MVSTKTTSATAVRLLYIIDVAAFFLGEDYVINFVGRLEDAQRMTGDEPSRYDICTTLSEINKAIRYYRSIL